VRRKGGKTGRRGERNKTEKEKLKPHQEHIPKAAKMARGLKGHHSVPNQSVSSTQVWPPFLCSVMAFHQNLAKPSLLPAVRAGK
jgi:hypothetical protein